jgi:hypothetical protein
MKYSRTSPVKRILARLAIIALMSAYINCPLSAQTNTAPKKKPVLYGVNTNHIMRVRINETIGSELSRIGDEFRSTLVDPVYSTSGIVLAPQGSVITGKVTHIQRAQKKGEPGIMDVEFIEIKLPNGKRYPMAGSLTDLSTKSGTSDNEGKVSANKTSHRKLKFIGGGAAGGGIIGAIAGGGKGLAIGAGVGALAGGITGRVKKGKEVTVDSGTEFGVILDKKLYLPKYGPR